jgi:hypothetical protein
MRRRSKPTQTDRADNRVDSEVVSRAIVGSFDDLSTMSKRAAAIQSNSLSALLGTDSPREAARQTSNLVFLPRRCDEVTTSVRPGPEPLGVRNRADRVLSSPFDVDYAFRLRSGLRPKSDPGTRRMASEPPDDDNPRHFIVTDVVLQPRPHAEERGQRTRDASVKTIEATAGAGTRTRCS